MIPEVGKAYRGRDGLIRWVTHRSMRNYYHLLWYHEETDAWHNGGRMTASTWEQGGCGEGGEVLAPAAGSVCKFCGVTGVMSERIVGG